MTAGAQVVPPAAGRQDRTAGGAGWLAGFGASAVVGVYLSFDVGGGQSILSVRWPLFEHFAVWFVAWALGVVCALHLPRRGAVILILLTAVVLRIGSLQNAPRLSNDAYRYSWDARVELAGIDPYRYPPDAHQLVALRDTWIWPDPSGCAALDHPPGCSIMNRDDVRTIYPPLAEAWFTAVYWIGGGIDSRYKLWQAAGFATELGTLALIMVLLRKRERDPRWLALYALSPIPVTEAVNNGHVDGLAVLLVTAAFVVLSCDVGARIRVVGAGALIGCAALVKLYPAAALVPLVAAPGLRLRHRISAVVAFVVVVVVGYLPHVAAVGVKVVGYLPGYLKAENYTGTGNRFLLVDLLRLKTTQDIDAVVAVIIIVTCGIIAWRRPDPVTGCGLLFGVLLLVATPVQPWYGLVLLAMAAASPRPRWGLVAAAGYPYFFAVILAAKHRTGVGQLSYGVTLTCVVGAAVIGRLRGSGSPSGETAGRPERPPAVIGLEQS